jgi:hypothetical protein
MKKKKSVGAEMKSFSQLIQEEFKNNPKLRKSLKALKIKNLKKRRTKRHRFFF